MMQNNLAILVNLGTPDAPENGAIRLWLRQFLSDPRVVDLPRMIWLPILYGFILPFRPGKVKEKYKLVWRDGQSPLRALTLELAARVQHNLGETWTVRTGMTYGAPPLAAALADAHTFERVVVLPLFPQYAASTTGAVFDGMAKVLARQVFTPYITMVNHYYQHPGYITALARSVESARGETDSVVIFSFHGIPVAQSDKGDPYLAQCQETAEAVALQLGLPDSRWRLTFQSRFGAAPWLSPYTDATLAELGRAKEAVCVVCPGFAVECLETLEEINITYRALYEREGGSRFVYVPALNASDNHAELLTAVIRGEGS